MVCYRARATLLLSVWHCIVSTAFFSSGVAKVCNASRELGMEAGVETNKGLRIMGWSAALFAAASALACPREIGSELLV